MGPSTPCATNLPAETCLTSPSSPRRRPHIFDRGYTTRRPEHYRSLKWSKGGPSGSPDLSRNFLARLVRCLRVTLLAAGTAVRLEVLLALRHRSVWRDADEPLGRC